MSTDFEAYQRVPPNVFGFFRYFLKFSPLNCSQSNPIRVVFVALTLVVLLSFIFRMFWMFGMTKGGEILSIAWAERNMYAFMASEAIPCLVAIYKMTSFGSLEKFENSLMAIQTMRNQKYYETHDNYNSLYRKLFILILPIFPAHLLLALWLGKYKYVTFGGHETNDWYYIINIIVTVFCAYVNVVFLPIHCLMNSAIRREFDVFNEELDKASKNKELNKAAIIQSYGERQLKLFEFTKTIFGRLSAFMGFCSLAMLTVLVMASFISANFAGYIYMFYYFTIMAVSIITVIMSSLLMVPPAMIQDAMLQTSNILLSEPMFQYSDDRLVQQTYRLMIDRSLHNRPCNNAVFIFSLTRKNVERAFFIITNIVLAMCVASTILKKKYN